jgi:hypothetical protein
MGDVYLVLGNGVGFFGFGFWGMGFGVWGFHPVYSDYYAISQ